MFSSDLNKTSIKNINKKNISIIQNKINKNINDILLLNKLLVDLIKKEEYIKIKNILKQYKLSSKYIDTILKIDKTIENGDFLRLDLCNKFYSNHIMPLSEYYKIAIN
jgi:hypothetical protein